MTDSEWAAIAALITTAWPSGRWPEESQALYRAKLDNCDAGQLAGVVDALTESADFLPPIAAILKEFKRRNPAKSGVNGAGYTYGSLEYFQRQYGDEQGKKEHQEWLEWRGSKRAQLDEARSGTNGPRRIGTTDFKGLLPNEPTP